MVSSAKDNSRTTLPSVFSSVTASPSDEHLSPEASRKSLPTVQLLSTPTANPSIRGPNSTISAAGTANSRKPSVSTAPVSPGLSILTSSIAAKGGPVPLPGSTSPFPNGTHNRRKSTVNQNSVPPTRRTWSIDNNNGVQFATTQNPPSALSANGMAAPIQFGSINTDGTAANGLNTGTGRSPSNTASPVPAHAVFSGGVPPFQAVPPTTALKFGTFDTEDNSNDGARAKEERTGSGSTIPRRDWEHTTARTDAPGTH
ncbi:uncharacterized protein V1518DRAFT_406730 [Limtongia smithiae]|uniref:uncharacterized protein n=1 Tax=Limtongia smithiae TaxID=1125753 RepID=UPI0034CE8697